MFIGVASSTETVTMETPNFLNAKMDRYPVGTSHISIFLIPYLKFNA